MHKGKRTVVVDFETYFDRKIGYDLQSISITEYVRDPRFWAFGMAYRFLDDEKTHWLGGNHDRDGNVINCHRRKHFGMPGKSTLSRRSSG